MDSWDGGVKTSLVHPLPKQKGHEGMNQPQTQAVVHVPRPSLVAKTEDHGITHPGSLRIKQLNRFELTAQRLFHCTPNAPSAMRGAL